MTARIGNRLINLAATVSIVALILGAVAGCGKKQPSPPKDANNLTAGGEQPDGLDKALGSPGQTPESITKLAEETKEWMAVFEPWWGKVAPPFTLTDIQGNVHTLSKYRDKNVVVLFWRTYNPTCKMAAARLKELRNSFTDGSLVILSISNETPAVLKEAATAQGINFPVLSGGADLLAPFSSVENVPTTFFINPKGQFKLAATGVISVDDAKAIINTK